MNPSLSDLHVFWLMLGWGFPLLAAALIVHHFILNYLRERAEEMSAIAKLARPAKKPGRREKAKETNRPPTCVVAAQKALPHKSDYRWRRGEKLVQPRSGAGT